MTTPRPQYNDVLDPDVQISTEETIASTIFDSVRCSEEEAAELGRDILTKVLVLFRPDLFAPEVWDGRREVTFDDLHRVR